MELILAFVIKTLDNALSNAKTIFIAKGRYLIGSFFNAGAFFFYSVALSQMIKSDSFSYIFMMCLAVFVGTYSSGILIKKSEKDKLFVYEITPNDIEQGKSFAFFLRTSGIPVITSYAYDFDNDRVLIIKAFCSTRKQSSLVDDMIPKEFKFHKYKTTA